MSIYYPVYGGDDYYKIGVCDMCGAEILEGEAHYDFPDGLLVCDEPECLSKWENRYKTNNR